MVARLGVGLAKFLAGTVLAILVFLVGAFFQVRGALPAYSGHLEARGLKAPVEITRDKKVVWQFNQYATFGNGLACSQVLDDKQSALVRKLLKK